MSHVYKSDSLSGLKTNFNPSVSYSAHKSFNTNHSPYKEQNAEEETVLMFVQLMMAHSLLKTKEMVVDFSKKKTPLAPLRMNDQHAQMVESFEFLGSTISKTPRWKDNPKKVSKNNPPPKKKKKKSNVFTLCVSLRSLVLTKRSLLSSTAQSF